MCEAAPPRTFSKRQARGDREATSSLMHANAVFFARAGLMGRSLLVPARPSRARGGDRWAFSLVGSWIAVQFSLCKRLTDTEARSAVIQMIARHAELRSLFSLLLYDDMCHPREYWQKHLDGVQNAQAARVLRFRGFPTRSHQRGHTRWQCHADFAANTCDDLNDFRTYTCLSACHALASVLA